MRDRLADVYRIVKKWWGDNNDTVFWGIIIFLAVVFGTGMVQLWMTVETKSVRFVDSNSEKAAQETLHQRYIQASGLPGLVAASRNGKRYYYPWCGGIKQIKEKNLVWFATEKAAEAVGYTIAKGCEGL